MRLVRLSAHRVAEILAKAECAAHPVAPAE
jgi:hypothetical protein